MTEVPVGTQSQKGLTCDAIPSVVYFVPDSNHV